MNHKRDCAVEMSSWVSPEWIQAQPPEEHENVPEKDGKRVAGKEVREPLGFGGFQKLLLRHDWEGPNVRAAELGIVLVMVIVGTAPNTAGRKRINSKDSHEGFGQFGAVENRVMLLVVINDEQAEDEQSRKHTAGDFSGRMKIPKRPRERCAQEKSRREDMPPTP